MNHLAVAWSTYAERVLPTRAGETQKIETKRAFYGGAQALFGLCTGPLTDLSDEDAETMLTSIDEELRAFVEDVKAGKE